MNYSSRVYWNSNSYGKAIRIKRSYIKGANLALGWIIPFVYPFWLAMILNKYVNNDIMVRYGK